MPTDPTPEKIEEGTEYIPTPTVLPKMIFMAENMPSLVVSRSAKGGLGVRRMLGVSGWQRSCCAGEAMISVSPDCFGVSGDGMRCVAIAKNVGVGSRVAVSYGLHRDASVLTRSLLGCWTSPSAS